MTTKASDLRLESKSAPALPEVDRRTSFSKLNGNSTGKEESQARRPSFAGLARGSFSARNVDEFDPASVIKSQDPIELAKRAAECASNMSLTGMLQINDLVFDRTDFDQDTSALEKLHTVMTKAKESGMTVDQIFSYFSTEKGQISPKAFAAALQKLGPGVFDFSEAELNDIFAVLDKDKNGSIDVQEFKEHCYRIPRLAWKAERIRMDRARRATEEKEKLKFAAPENLPPSPSSRMMHNLDTLHHQGEPEDEAHRQASEVIFRGQKLFWRTHEKVDLIMHEYHGLGCMVVTALNTTKNISYKPLIINKVIIEESVEDKAVEEQISANRQEFRLRRGIVDRKLTEEEESEIQENVRRGILSSYVLLRLQQTDDAQLTLLRLSLDTYKEGELLIKNPGIKSMPEAPAVAEKVDMHAFNSMNKELMSTAADMRRLSKSAERMSRIISTSLDAFGNLAAHKGESHINKIRRKAMRALRQTPHMQNYRKDQVEKMRLRLANSATYQEHVRQLNERRAELAARRAAVEAEKAERKAAAAATAAAAAEESTPAEDDPSKAQSP